MSDREDAAECTSCRSPIRTGASICPVCKAHQARWRNTTTYLAGITGLGALIASATTYIFTSVVELRKQAAWKDDVTVIHFSSIDTVLIANSGFGEIFVTHVEVYFGDGANRRYEVNSAIHAGQFVSAKMQNKMDPPMDDRWGYVSIADTETKDIGGYLFSRRECATSIFLSRTHPDLDRMKDHYDRIGKRLLMSDANAFVFFASGKSGYVIRKNFPVQWLMAELPQCVPK
jgi:hypothetical protein